MSQVEGAPARPDDKRLKGRHIALAVGIPVVLVFGGLVLAMTGGGNAEGSSISACQSAVKDRLKAPSTADFSSVAAEVKPGLWRVTGDVDAQNSFGAQVRTAYTCTVAWSNRSASVASVSVG